ncbi:MAG: mechanosensitive ion channel [Lachnospiraceae bacterium]|nr:mechanosensitive ion channel [Lachnospiraceae bacterium]
MLILAKGDINDLSDVADVEISIFKEFTNNLKLNSLDFLMRILIAIVVLVAGRYVINFIRKWLRKILERSNVEPGNIQLLDQVVKVSLYFLVFLFVAAHFGIEAASVIALLGSAGLTIGLAFQGALSNFAGGVLLMSTKPFKLGDFIEIEASFTGTVTEIGLVHTKLLTVDNRVIIVPNGELANSTVINYTDREHRRVELTVSIAYSQDIDQAKAVLKKVIEAEKRVVHERDVLIYVEAMSASSVDLGIKVYTMTEQYLAVKWSLTEQIKKAFDREGIEIPFPQMDIHVKDGVGEKKG